MQPKVMRGRRADAGDSGTRSFATGQDRLRDLARIAGDLGADEMVHDAVALAERSDATTDLMNAAVERFADRLIFEIDERRSALMRPPALSGSHATVLRNAIADAQQWLRESSHQSTAEQDAIVDRLKAERDRFLATFHAAAALLRTAVEREGVGRWQLRQAAAGHATGIAAAAVREWASEIRPRAAAMHREAVEGYARATQQLIERIRAAGVSVEGELTGDAADIAHPERTGATMAPPLGWRSMARAVIGSSDRSAAIHEAMSVLREAMESGSAHVVDAFRDALTLARRRIEWEIALQLRATADALKRASDAARAAQSEGAQGMATELNRLDELANRLAMIVDR
jgi:hypothetical protein